MTDTLKICEVAPRDGLQSLGYLLSVEQRIAFCRRLIQAGLNKIEVGSLVNPQVVPAMANSDLVFTALKQEFPTAELSLLVPNEKGLQKALQLEAKYLAFFTATSETFNLKNINRTIAESLAQITNMATQARQAGCTTLRLYISTLFHCPYEGLKNPLVDLLNFESLFSLFDEISLGDTTGQGTVEAMEKLILWLEGKAYRHKVWWHFHDTYQRAAALVRLALKAGYRQFDSSANGIGGCPFAPGAKGNIDTLTVLSLAEEFGLTHSIDSQQVKQASWAL